MIFNKMKDKSSARIRISIRVFTPIQLYTGMTIKGNDENDSTMTFVTNKEQEEIKCIIGQK